MMKNPRLLLVSTIAMAFVLIAFSSSPPNGNTGAPGEGVCSSCHGGSNPLGLDGNIAISGTGPTVLAGETYLVSVLLTNPNGLAQRAGFQIVALDENDNNIGTLSNPSASSTISTSGGRTYFKHNPAVNFPATNEVEWTVEWTAPSDPSSTTVNFYGAGNIADGNNASSNDLIVTTLFSASIEIPAQPLSVEIIAQSDVNCFGELNGSAEAEASGGSGSGYSFLWSNGETGPIAVQLGAGLQAVTVTDDAGATAETSVIIAEPDLAEIVLIELSHVSCDGGDNGFISVQAVGGNPPYNFTWSDGSVGSEISGLTAGEYQLTATDENGCTATSSFIVLDGSPIEVVEVVDNVSCNGGDDGSISLFPSGENPPFTAVWSNGEVGLDLSDLSAGLYNATITDVAGCEAVVTVEIFEAAPILPNASVSAVSCNSGMDGSIELNPSGDQPPFNASWSNGFIGLNNIMLEAGTYEFTLTDALGCEVFGSEEIEEPDAIQISFTAVQPSCSSCDDGSITANVSGGTGGYSFIWDTDPLQSSATAGSLLPGDYSVTVTDENNCTASATFNLLAEGSCDSIIAYFFNQTEVLCDAGDLLNYCFILGAPQDDSIPWPGCEGETLLNPQWISFVAGSDEVSFSLQISDCVLGLGLQIGVYEIPPNINYHSTESGLHPEEEWLVGDCSMVITPQSGTISFSVPTQSGLTYGIVFSGLEGDECQVEFLEVVGAQNAPDLTGVQSGEPVLVIDGFGGSEVDTFCPGSIGWWFTIEEEVSGASYYLWSFGGQEISTENNGLIAVVDFPETGTFELCVTPANTCSTGEPACLEVVVSPPSPFVQFDTLCLRQEYFWEEEIFGFIDLLGPFTLPGEYHFIDTIVNVVGCPREAFLSLHVLPDNFDKPTEFFEVICWDDPNPVYVPFEGHPQAQSFDMTGIYGLDGELFITQESFPGNVFECDSFFLLELLVLEADIGSLDFECSGSELLLYHTESLSLPGLQAYVDQMVVRYEWRRAADGSILSSGFYSDSTDLLLNLSVEELTEAVEIFSLHLFSRYSEDPDSLECENIFSIEIIPSDLDAIEVEINGPDTLMPGEQYIFFIEEIAGMATFVSWSFDPEPEEVVIDFSTRAANVVFTEPGEAQICIVASNFCGLMDSTCIVVMVDTDVATPFFPAEEFNFQVYPNPFAQLTQVHSDLKIGSASWELYNVEGRQLLKGEGEYEKKIPVNTGTLPPGIYFLKLLLEEGAVMFKVVKQ
ncbi:MAG: T9SS C-terminal target domain-containing protein [Saprospirales bacterium]|nr:MAG: T9SS C-terminal target domain-containing protein [Saprospirales bacterium]